MVIDSICDSGFDVCFVGEVSLYIWRWAQAGCHMRSAYSLLSTCSL